MKWTKRLGLELIAIFLMVAVVSMLAVFQYRWTDEISRNEQTRLKSSLETSVRNFDQEFSYDFQRLCEGFEIDPESEPPSVESRVARQYLNWSKTDAQSGLVAGLYIWKAGFAGSPHLEEFSESDKRFHDVDWPAQFDSLHHFLIQQKGLRSSVIDDREAFYFPWTFIDEVPALVRPIFQTSSTDSNASVTVQSIGYLVVALNTEVLKQQYLVDMVDRHFGAAGQKSFVVSIRLSKSPFQTIYSSDTNFQMAAATPDATVNLFDLVGEEARRRGHPPLQSSSGDGQWQLVVQHPAGSLEVAVSEWRRRNLAISFGLLAVLAGSMSLIFSVARRAKALARLQMEFVAGVSHELCTPLAVINSAAENLVDGVVDNSEQMQEYGGIIRGQGRRLERLVDEVLLFTAGRFGLSGYDLAPVEVAPVIAQSLATSEPFLRDAGFHVEKEISPDLPPVMADASAVITCIENLMSNAIKYGSSSHWVAIRARMDGSNSHHEVRISVEDRGIGIPEADIPHIFEPFYRVQAVREHQIRGVGLGLHLVKRMMEDMGGRVSVSSELGRGTEVVLHFPVIHTEEFEPREAAVS